MFELLNNLGAARGAGVRIAIVDSGVQADHPWVGGRLTASFQVVGGTQIKAGPPNDVFGHGTACAGQIRRFAPEADLVSVQVLGGNLKANSQSLLTALRWLTTQDIHLINLSLSTMRQELALLMSHAVDDLYARKIRASAPAVITAPAKPIRPTSPARSASVSNSSRPASSNSGLTTTPPSMPPGSR